MIAEPIVYVLVCIQNRWSNKST